MLHCRPGDEAIMEANAHVYYYEGGAAASIAGVMPRLVEGRRGVFTAADVEEVLRHEDIHFPRTRLICVESSHNRGGGSVVPLETMAGLADLARSRRLAVHLDGARLFNAAVALGVEAGEIAAHVDTVMFCLSKGLSAPVGSMLAGTRELVAEARRIRKRLGGGMRQAGVLAAAGILALTEMTNRLAEDHENARALGEGLAAIEGCEVDLETVQTNMVVLDVSGLGLTSAEFLTRLARSGIHASPRPPHGVRFVTHRHVSRGDIRTVIEAVAALAADR
jgi:threonine aldolase